LHMVQLMPLPSTNPIISLPYLNPDLVLPFSYRLTKAVLVKKAVKRLCVCCVYIAGKSSADVDAGVPEHARGGKDKLYLCTVCDKRFTNKKNLSAHRYIHSREDSYACTLCEKRFSSSNDLCRHMNVHTGKYKCRHCGKCCESSHSLQIHKQSHPGEKRYQCTVCSRLSSCSANLVSHSRIHSGEKPHKCHVCGKGFSLSGNLTNHVRIHTGEKPFKCSVCDERFTESSKLQKHTFRVHSGSKLFEYHCFYCQNVFKVEHELSADTEPHLCKRCIDLQTAFGIRTPDTSAEVTLPQ